MGGFLIKSLTIFHPSRFASAEDVAQRLLLGLPEGSEASTPMVHAVARFLASVRAARCHPWFSRWVVGACFGCGAKKMSWKTQDSFVFARLEHQQVHNHKKRFLATTSKLLWAYFYRLTRKMKKEAYSLFSDRR